VRGLVKQISVFLENKPGRLAELMKVLEGSKIKVKAMGIAETGSYGVIRMVVDRHEEALKTLREANMAANEASVLAISLEDGLYKASKALGEAGVNIEYAYTALNAVIVKVDDEARARKALEQAGVKVLEHI